MNLKKFYIFLVIGSIISICGISAENFIDFKNLKNPVFEYPGWSIKDSCMAYYNGDFYIFFSAFYFDRGRMRCHISGVKTSDFRNYSEPLFIWSGEESGFRGMCSPNISKIDYVFYLTYNSWGDDKKSPNQLFYARSNDLMHWEKDIPLAPELTQGKRAIDAGIAKANGKFYLVWKEEQTPMMAVGDTLGDKGWKRLGVVPGGWFENGEFIRIDGKWYLLVTDRAHLPALREIRGDGASDDDWLNLGEFKRLEIPGEKFNTVEKANCAFLADFRKYDGYFYLLYSGRNKGLRQIGDRYFKLGLARSTNLKVWELPGHNE